MPGSSFIFTTRNILLFPISPLPPYTTADENNEIKYFCVFSFIAEKEVNVDKRLHLQRKYLSLFRKVKQWITFTRTFRHKTCSFQRIFGIFCLILTSPSQVDEANISKIDGFTGGRNSSNLKVFKWIQFISFSVAA